MKRFLCLVGVVLVLVGIRLGNNGLSGLSLPYGASFEIHRVGGVEVMAYEDVPLLSRWGEHLGQRIDFVGGYSEAIGILRQLGAREVRRERVGIYGEVLVIYALAGRLRGRTAEYWGDFNVMVAIRGNRVAVGYPILIGSF